jgi:transcriptional regulator with XRE-family HTH domain
MTDKKEAVSPGFGARLREERMRLKLSQSDFAKLAGVQRLAQGQYEQEIRTPSVKYLSAVVGAGADLNYLIHGRRPVAEDLSPDQLRRIERQAFDLIEDYVRTKCEGQLSSEGRFVLFEVLKAHLTQISSGGSTQEMNFMDILSSPRNAA